MKEGQSLAWVSIAGLLGADDQGGVQIQAEGRVQRLRERAAEGVQEHHCVRHTVEGQSSFLPFQEHTDPRAGRCSHCGFSIVVPGGISSVCTPQPPRVLIASQEAGLSASFASDSAVGDTNVNPSSAPPLHLPVAGATKLALLAQDLGHRIKSLGVRGVGLGLLATVGTLAPLQENQSRVGCIQVQRQTTRNWREREERTRLTSPMFCE